MDDKFFLSMIDKFNSAGITELEFSDGNTRLTLKKDNGQGKAVILQDEGSHSEEAHVRLGISAHSSGEKIKSPIVATFYSSPGPDAPPFVKPGSKIRAGQTLCILEAMKMMNHLEAEFDCEIIEILASSGDLVEYGQELFIVKRN